MKNLLLPISLLCLLLANSCKEKGCTSENASNYSPSAKINDGSCVYTSDYDLDGTIDGLAHFDIMVDGEHQVITDSNRYQITYTTFSNYYATPLDYHKSGGSFSNDNTGNIYIGIFHNNLGANPPIYSDSYLSPGEGNYYRNKYPEYIDNTFEVSMYRDGVFYNSAYGEQNNSSFTIISSKERIYNDINAVMLEIELNCKVYNINAPSEYKTIENGRVILPVKI